MSLTFHNKIARDVSIEQYIEVSIMCINDTLFITVNMTLLMLHIYKKHYYCYDVTAYLKVSLITLTNRAYSVNNML